MTQSIGGKSYNVYCKRCASEYIAMGVGSMTPDADYPLVCSTCNRITMHYAQPALDSKIRVDVERVWNLSNQRREINELNFSDIEWYERGEKLDIPQEVLDDWLELLNNMDFITTRYYQKEGTDV